MRNGTFCVNYSLLEGIQREKQDYDEENYQMDTEEIFDELSIVEGKAKAPVDIEVDAEAAKELIDSVVGSGLPALEHLGRKTFNQLMFDQVSSFYEAKEIKKGKQDANKFSVTVE